MVIGYHFYYNYCRRKMLCVNNIQVVQPYYHAERSYADLNALACLFIFNVSYGVKCVIFYLYIIF